jgi:hypothetical protein
MLALLFKVLIGVSVLLAGQAMSQNRPPQLEALPMAPPRRNSSPASAS